MLLPSIAALLAAWLVVVAPAGAATNKCQRFTSKYGIAAQSTASVVFQTGKPSVFQTGKRRIVPRVDPTPGKGIAYGCRFADGKLRKLSASGDEITYGFELAGRFVAYASNSDEPAGAFTVAGMHVVDLKSGNTVFEKDAYVVGPAPPNEFSYTVDSIVLRANGSVAWLTDASINDQENLVARRQGTSATVLDRGKDVRLGSLALSRNGKTAFWTRGATAKAAPMR